MRTPLWFPAALLAAALLVSALVSGHAHAQVATPSLVPLGGAVTGNAATLPFAPQSFIGGAAGEGDASTVDETLGQEIGAGDTETQQVHLRLVGETFALAADRIASEIAQAQTASRPFLFHVEEDVTRGALAGRMGDRTAVGLSVEQREADAESRIDIPGTGVVVERTESRRTSLPVAGLVVRLGSVFFLGAAYGQETLELDQQESVIPPPPALATQSFEVERDVRRAGAGLLWIGAGGSAVRLEVAVEARDPYEQPDIQGSSTTVATDEREGTRAEVELRWGALSLAANAGREEVSDDGTVTEEQDSAGVAVGWVPQTGLAVTVARLEQTVRVDNPAVLTGETTLETTVVGLHWMF